MQHRVDKVIFSTCVLLQFGQRSGTPGPASGYC